MPCPDPRPTTRRHAFLHATGLPDTPTTASESLNQPPKHVRLRAQHRIACTGPLWCNHTGSCMGSTALQHRDVQLAMDKQHGPCMGLGFSTAPLQSAPYIACLAVWTSRVDHFCASCLPSCPAAKLYLSVVTVNHHAGSRARLHYCPTQIHIPRCGENVLLLTDRLRVLGRRSSDDSPVQLAV